jgi:hypothetical protein
MNGKLEELWKEVWPEKLSWHLPEGTEENCEKPVRIALFLPRFKPSNILT